MRKATSWDTHAYAKPTPKISRKHLDVHTHLSVCGYGLKSKRDENEAFCTSCF